ncbi:hypothetical protein DWB61_10490 [Ancylomarina euxinus]|uniref:Uncharacterized protein n=1 Tax=Ancylomarina euxinus TaxID=2283627 RepID=A0A425Y0A8_9BACT|nr:hypothetical protein [Ancylomarina euxinus]MCZ4695255.1 hypothetical protein [Ancylomarina euxinus]MUP15452.1 hypothetical protein [Ancylomarina euxinus]RRG21162.1 hypothetical protein DWB61_10490 [Ancylomarina euxinus]
MAAWPFIAGLIDSILFPGIVVYAIFHGVVDYKVLTPPILFLGANILAKLIYILISLKGKVKVYDILISVLPYAGSAYLLRKFLIKDQLLSQTVYAFLKMKKLEIKGQIIEFIKKKTKL